MRRYNNLFRIIKERKCKKIVEIGTFNGVHAKQMIETAIESNGRENVEYYGYDLFEDLTDKKYDVEFSKNPSVKERVENILPHIELVKTLLEETHIKFILFKGDSKITLPETRHLIQDADFVFIDGGHSKKTINSDWSVIKTIMNENTIVVFDDYYHSIHKEKFGCNEIIDNLDRNIYDIEELHPIDYFPANGVEVQMIAVKLK